MKLAIIGAGPAGIYTSLLLKFFPGEVHLFEQNKNIGEKLKITGGGRMNISNKDFNSNYFSSTEAKILKHIFKSPWIQKREYILKELGVEYKWEKNRAILKNENAIQEVKRLQELLMKQKNIQLHLSSQVKNIETSQSKYILHFQENQNLNSEPFDIVILCSGGMFRIREKSKKSEIYNLAKNLSHSITETAPSLSAIYINNTPFSNLAGLSFEGQLKIPSSKIQVTEDILFTHKGISGPATLDFSSYIDDTKQEITLSFLPQVKQEFFMKKLETLRQGKHSLKTFLQRFLAQRLVKWHLETCKLPFEINIADLNKAKLQELMNQLFHFPLKNIELPGYEYAWTTKGGISLKEIETGSLESKFHKNVYFAGEILDINGLCGGYNISFAAISAKIISETIYKKYL